MLNRVLIALIFVLLYIYIYIYYLNLNFEYLGFEINREFNLSNLLISVLVSVLPIFFYKENKKVSNVISSLIYLLLYVPTIITFSFAWKYQMLELYYIYFVFLVSMLIIFIPNQIYINGGKSVQKFKILDIRSLIFVSSALIIVFIIKFQSTMKIVTWGDEMYELREINSDLGLDFYSRYVSGWLVFVLMPFIFVYGLIYNNKGYLYIIAFFTLIMYMILAAKIVVLLPVFIYVIYKLFIKFQLSNFFNNTVKFLILISITLLLLNLFVDNEIYFYIPSMLFMRTIGNGGLLNFWYFDFFSNHPITYFSHVNIINFFTNNYKYGEIGLGKVVGTHYWSSTMNANANFWATDGIASLGLIGVLFISLVLSLLLIILNFITDLNKNNFHILVLLPFLASLTNTSLFSSILTGGLFLIMILFLILKNPNK